ncbi:lipopolysaccharide assembly protein LapA domain-containing protein [Dasania marina]|uniref:lipopolysaccharide assembly protein LapA domain-containing protein n=1 Tax=Dasania marina TaxID=471499 RepID=UPI00035ED34F|nr:LapA family protein [Dasania marina]|tara:strand:- start:82554 stop:82742 length:189 start_codon:yes stop_codon:yes gene_type:complete
MPRLLMGFLLVLFMVLLVQNLAAVEVSFLFWSLSLPRVVLLTLIFSMGVLFGYSLHWLKKPK